MPFEAHNGLDVDRKAIFIGNRASFFPEFQAIIDEFPGSIRLVQYIWEALQRAYAAARLTAVSA